MHEKKNNRVVITGIGPVTSIGTGLEEFWNNLLAGEANIKPIPEVFEQDYTFKSRFLAPYPEFSLEAYGFKSRLLMLTEETGRLALVGAKLAFDDAGIDHESEQGSDLSERTTVVLGNGICTIKAGFEGFSAHSMPGNQAFFEKYGFSPRYNRMVIPAIMPDSAACWISIHFGLHGENYTLNTSCASGSYAIGEAYRKIRYGIADRAVTGGVECLQDPSGTIMRGFDTLGTLTKSEDGYPRPFSKNRSGFLFSEGGACILILERLDLALERGADIYAEIAGYESCSDAYNLVQIEPSGKQIRNMLKTVVGKEKVDYFNTHGTATQLNDEFERILIQDMFGKKSGQPWVNSTKGTLGHSIGASGAIEAAVTALSIKHSKVHRNESDDDFEDLNLATASIDTEINTALSASYGFGGHNAALLLKKFNG